MLLKYYKIYIQIMHNLQENRYEYRKLRTKLCEARDNIRSI